MADKKIILVIDDETDLAEMVSFQLKAKGYAVTMASNGVEGLKVLEKVNPDLIVLDINMPKMGGLEFYNKISTSHGKAKYPVLVLTARANLEETFKDIEVDGFMPKPFEIEKLIIEVDRIVSRKSEKHIYLLDVKGNSRTKEIKEKLEQERYSVAVLEDAETLKIRATTIGGLMPCCILMEYMQQGLSGDVVIKKIKEISSIKDVPIVVYSYTGFQAYEEKSIAAGASRYLGKPESYDVFITAVKELEIIR